MTSSFVVYIDESGDEGFSFDKGSSEWFILSAVITVQAKDIQVVKLVDTVRTRLGKQPKATLHFRDLKHEHRLVYSDEIAKGELKTVSVLVHKPSLKEPEKFQERYRLYFYSVRYLFERVSWYCRDHKTKQIAGDGSAEVVFSNRSGMSYDEMKDYMDHLQEQSGPLGVRIEWNVIKSDQISSLTSGKRMGLQIADAVAGSLLYAAQPTQYGFTEDRYARMLKPVVYHREGQFVGYGLKFWPREVDSLLVGEERFRWIREVYK